MQLTARTLISLACMGLLLSACTANQQQGASRGAGVGALAGAAGSMMTALVFGGNVGEAAARGAVFGASAGAVTGAVAGNSKDSKEAQQRRAEQEKQLQLLRKEIGDDAFEGVTALVQCKHEVAMAYGRTAEKSGKANYERAGLWLQALTLEDMGQETALQDLAPQIISADSRINSTETAIERLESYKESLRQIRAEFDLPERC